MNLKTGLRLASLGAAAVLQASTCAGAWRDANRNGTMEPYEDPAQTVAARVDDLVSRMTPDEKAGQLNLPYWSPRKDNAAVERLIASGGGRAAGFRMQWRIKVKLCSKARCDRPTFLQTLGLTRL